MSPDYEKNQFNLTSQINNNRYDWAYWAERVLGDINNLADDIKNLQKKNEKLNIDMVVLKTKVYIIVCGISAVITIGSNFLLKYLLG
jgi:hypothetical protein